MKLNIKTILFTAGVIGFFILVITFQLYMNENDYQNMKNYKPLVESSFKDNQFSLPEKVVDDSLRYTIKVKDDSIVLKYTMMAEKGKQLTVVTMRATKTEDGFQWSCKKDLIIFPTIDC